MSKADTNKLEHFENFCQRLKNMGLIKDYEIDKKAHTAKIQPMLSVRPIYHIKIHEEWNGE